MPVYLFYTKDTPGESQMRDLGEQLRHSQVEYELIEADSEHGAALSENYDILARPAVVLAAGDGTLINQWQHELPSASDISYWAHR